MTKIEVISQKASKPGFLAKKGHFLTVFSQENLRFWIFPRVKLLVYTRKHLGEDFRKFSVKTNDKIEVIRQKPSKNWIFGRNGHFWHFLAKKIPDFEFLNEYHYSYTLEDI